MNKLTLRTSLLALLFLAGLSVNATGCLVVVDEGGGRGHDGDEWGWDDDRDRDCDDDDQDQNNATPDDNNTTDPDVDCPEPGDVCGEDGVTYPSACDASRAHVRIAHDGACGQACFFDDECNIGDTCNDQGRCAPVVCAEIYEPVCGADGNTYSNACEASAQHVQVSYSGECAPACQADVDCGAGDICEGNICVPANCPVLDPADHAQEVCGADGFTYQTACEARVDRVEVIHEGCCI